MKRSARKSRALLRAGAIALCVATLAGCHQDMWNQPRYGTYQKSTTFADNSSARKPVEGTLPYDGTRAHWNAPVFARLTDQEQVPSLSDLAFHSGRTEDGAYVPDNYFPLDRALFERGKERFEVTCAACHGLTGAGDGLITLRGFPTPPSFHIDRIREVEDGYIFDVITNGFGRMYSYASRVTPEDRWAIIAYIRALQFSQNIDMTDPNAGFAQAVAQGFEEQEARRAAEAAAAAAAMHHGDEPHEEDHGGEHGEAAPETSAEPASH